MPRAPAEPFPVYRPEIEFLLASVAVTRERPIINRAASLAGGVLDWNLILALADFHRVTPLLHQFVRDCCGKFVPDQARSALRASFLQIWHHNTRLARELVKITQAIEQAGVPVIALKGPALAVQLWRDPAMRQYDDLDLLVLRKDLPQVAGLLGERGYRPRRYFSDSPNGGSFFDFASEFFRTEDGAAIDLHTALSPFYFPTGLDPAKIWQNAVRVEAEGETVLTLGPADSARFIAAHAAKHGWRSLSFVCDFAALASTCRDQLDWETLLDTTVHGGARMMRLAIILAEEVCNAPIPEAAGAAARCDGAAVALAREIRLRMFESYEDRLSLFHDWVVPLRAIESRRWCLQYVLGRGLRPTVEDREFIRLPQRMHWAYYLTRPFRMLKLHGHRLFGFGSISRLARAGLYDRRRPHS